MNRIVFLCPFGGAKSVIAASYFNRAAEELPYTAIAAAAQTPYEAVPPVVAELLARDGFDVASFRPRRVEADDLDGAEKVIAIDCDVAAEEVERWDDVPKVSEDLHGSVAAIRRHVNELVERLRASRE